MDALGAGPVTKGGELTLERATRLRLGRVEDGVRGAKVGPVGAEKLGYHRVLRAQGRPEGNGVIFMATSKHDINYL